MQIHSCNPITSVEDAAKERNRKRAEGAVYCNHTLQECNCVKPEGIMLI